MIVKLQKGQSVLLTVTGVVRDVPSNYGPEVKFVGRTPTDPDAAIFLKPETAERQLGRIGLTLDSVVGQTVEFAKPDKFIDINRAGPASVSSTRVPTTTVAGKQPLSSGGPLPWEGQETGAPPAEAQGVDFGALNRLNKQFNLYDACLDHALAAAKKRFGNDVTDTAVAAMCATLYIQACQRGAAA